MTNLVSVVIPLCGVTHLTRFKLVLESMHLQKNVSLEIILAGFKFATKIEDFSNETFFEKSPDGVKMGEVLNRGLHLASGNFTYVTDADILLTDNEYLSKLVQQSYSSGKFLKRPPMRRLLLQDFNWFNSIFQQKGLIKALNFLDYSEDYLVKPFNEERRIKVFKKFENGRDKTFIISEQDFKKYSSDEKNKGDEPIYFNQDRHCGAIFAPHDAFLQVGGYHEGFTSWGVWDADIQWKLEHLSGMSLIPNEKRFEVVHLDHLKGYFDRTKWATDKALQVTRRKAGAERCMELDKVSYFGRIYA